MEYQVIISVTPKIANTQEVHAVVNEGKAIDELQARGIASSISGCNFLDAKDFAPYRIGGWEHSYIVKLTETTSWILNIK